MPGTKYNQLKDKDPKMEAYLAKVAKAESGDNPNAKNPNGTATGLFQFVDSTWKGMNDRYKLGYTLEDRTNPEKSANVMRLFTEDNEKVLSPVLGRELTDGERYMGHFLGAGGASRFYRVKGINPNAPISTVMSPEALKANKGVVYNKDGSLKTVSQVQAWADEKMGAEVEPKVYTSTAEIKTTAYDTPPRPELLISSVPLQTSTAVYEEPVNEPQEVQQAKQDINEKAFVQDLGGILSRPIEQPQQMMQQEPVLDPSAYDYINIEEYQRGGIQRYYQDGGSYEADKEWLQNWYAEREIPNEYINNLYLQDRDNYTTLSEFLPDPEIVDIIDNDPEIIGQYNPIDASIQMIDSAPNSVYLHEATHRTQDFEGAMRPVHKMIVKDNILPREQTTGYHNQEYDYFNNPDEIHARIQSLRRKANIQPNQEVTPEFLREFFNTYQGDESDINDLLQLTNEKGLLEMLNYMALNAETTDNNLV